MRVLASGDLHIGRSSTRLPDEVSAADRSAAAAWDRLVRTAIGEGVGAVLLAGDVADQDNRYWEAIGPLERGVADLAAARIRTVAVAGNHDHDVLPRLADRLPPDRFLLLGRGGRWERATLADESGRPALQVDGWSFPAARVLTDPVESYDLPRTGDLPTIGLLHGDLSAHDSPYAPLRPDRLARAGPDAWLLGHIHLPAVHDLGGGRFALYPGSPQALDPGEPGVHGVWRFDVPGPTLTEPTLAPLSTVRYDTVAVDLSGVPASELQARIQQVLKEAGERMVAEGGAALQAVRLRVRLVGSSDVADRVGAATEGLVGAHQERIDDVSVTVEALRDEVLPAIDLEAHAATGSAPGVLARLLLHLADEEADLPEEAARAAREAIRAVDANAVYQSLDDDPVSEEQLREQLTEAARALLRELLTETAT